jgi:hypothetical protein
MDKVSNEKKFFVEFTTNGFPLVLAFAAIFSISETPNGEALVNGMLVDQKFSDIISTLDSIGVYRVSTKV